MNYLWKRVVTAILLLIFLVPIGAVAQPEEKITVCHYPPGNINNLHTIEIAPGALNAHIGSLGHAPGLDYIGPCRENSEIPNFPLIVLPVAGIMGIVFIISTRRSKK